MDYLLAKALEDAGFPQGGKGSFVAPPDKIVVRRQDRVYSPTLSELIEACGDEFGEMARRSESVWDAVNRGSSKRETGRTPEEAVARLWLALNRNA